MYLSLSLSLSLYLSLSLGFLCQVKSPHHSDQMSQGHKALGSLCMSKSKRSLYVVTGVGIELSQTLVWTAKKGWWHSNSFE